MCFFDPVTLAAFSSAAGPGGMPLMGSTFLGLSSSAWSTLGTVASLAGTGIQAMGQYDSASVAQQVAKNNAKIAESQAKDAESRGEQEALDLRRKAAQFKGGQRAKMAANGLDLTYGTQADILDQTDFFSQMDEATVRTNARKEAWNRRAQKANYQAEATSFSPWATAAGTMLTGAGQVASKWYT